VTVVECGDTLRGLAVKAEQLNDSVTLYEGDCLEVLPTLESESIDLLATDPPYGMNYQSARRIDSSSRFDVIDGDEKPQTAWIEHAPRLLTQGACVLCFCEWRGAEEFRTAFEGHGVKVAGQLVWDRIAHGLGDPSSRPAPQHDLIWFGVNGRFQFSGRRPTSIYRFMRMGGNELLHPTQKPIALMRQLVSDYTAEGDTVLDPFAGSGTTGIAAMMEGRKCILIEKDPKYCGIIRRRVERFDCQQPGSLFRTQPALC